MSRAAILRALYDSEDLQELGITEDEIFPNYAIDETPGRGKRFLIIRFEEMRPTSSRRGPHRMTVWAHSPVQLSTDYGHLDKILERVKETLLPLEDVTGDDGNKLTCVAFTGTSGDLRDPGYETITKNSAFEVLFRVA